MPQIGEHRLHRGEPAANHVASALAVDFALHALDGALGLARGAPQEDRDLAHHGLVGMPQAGCAQAAAAAVALGTGKFDSFKAVEVVVAAVAVQALAGRADAMRQICGGAKLLGAEQARLVALGGLVPQRIGLVSCRCCSAKRASRLRQPPSGM